MTKPKGKDLTAFKAAHSKAYIVPQKIREGLQALGDSWMYEGDFMRLCGVCQTDFSGYREQFADFWVQTGGAGSKRVWAGTKKFAASLREQLA